MRRATQSANWLEATAFNVVLDAVTVWMLTAAALAMPCSASNELVTTLTVSMDSSAGVYMG